MGRRRYFYTLIAGSTVWLVAAGSAFAQAPVPPVAPAQGGGAAPNRPGRAFPQGRERWRDMSPADRQHFQTNIERWRQMPPEERRELRERVGWRRQRLQNEAETAMRELGLQLETDKRAEFEQRYMLERKRIERALRQELQEKRQRELAPVVERLKNEFAPVQPSAAPSANSSRGSSSPSSK